MMSHSPLAKKLTSRTSFSDMQEEQS